MRPRKEMSRFAVKQRENLNIYWKILVIQPKNTAENENPKKSPRLLPTEPIKSCKLRTKTSSMMTFIPIEIQDISVFLVYYIYFFLTNHVTIPLQRNLWLSKSVPGPVILEFFCPRSPPGDGIGWLRIYESFDVQNYFEIYIFKGQGHKIIWTFHCTWTFQHYVK